MISRFRNLLLLAIGALLGLALSVGSGVFAQKEQQRGEPLPWDDARLLAEVLERVRQEYVEPVEDSELIESAVRGMVTDLDPHSQFLDSEEYEEVRISTTGNYSGVGLEVHLDEGIVKVVAAIEGSPAEIAGLRSGDIIVGIDDIDLDETNMGDAVSHMRGEPGTTVEIFVLRGDDPEPYSFKVKRSNVRLRSVRHQLISADTGYLRITHFSDTTWRDMRKALKQLRNENNGPLTGLVLDLRNNPGGVLEAAIDVSDGFLNGGLIVRAVGRGPDSNFSHAARSGDLLDGASLVVLVNEGSASASEIVAGALQDNERAIITGTKTFGKGSIQTVMPLSDGRAIKLTTSRYFTPNGDSIHGSGITPDVQVEADPVLDLLAGVNSHQTDAGAALLQGDKQLREAVLLLENQNPVLNNRPVKVSTAE